MSNLYYESTIAHYGVRGQKWGVRRYQTSQGRWTSLGRKRNQVKDLKRSERDKTDRTKARLEAQKKKLAYEKSLGPSEHPVKDAIKDKAKTAAKETVIKAKINKAKYDEAIAESKKFERSTNDSETAKFLKSCGMTTLVAISKSETKHQYTKDDIKDAWKEKVSDIRDDLVYKIDNVKFR